MVFFSPMVELALVSMAVSLFSQFIQTKIGGKKQLKEHQEKMKKTQIRIKELLEKNDEKSRKEREELEKEMLESMNNILNPLMKSMAVSLIVFIPIFMFMGSVYSEEVIDLPLPVPWISTSFDLLNPVSWFELYTQTSWIGWYVLISLIFSIFILNPITKVLEKIKQGGQDTKTS